MTKSSLAPLLRSALTLGLACGMTLASASARATTPLDPAQFPSEATYRGQALDASGAPLEGSHALEIRYFDGVRELLVERQEGVAVAGGRFTVRLGTGSLRRGADPAAATTLRAVFAQSATVAMEIAIDGVAQAPRVHILPAGHSPKSRAILAGRPAGGDEKEQVEGWSNRAGASAIQAAVLRPGDPRAGGESALRAPAGPFEAEMIGPILSAPLRSLPVQDMTARPDVRDDAEEINRPRHGDLFDEKGVRFGTGTEKIQDPLAGHSLGPAGLQTPTPLLNFEGMGNLNGVLPPDTEGAVGPDHYVQIVNLSLAIYDKSGSGTPVAGPFDTNTIWAGFGANCQTDNDGDAIVLYDRHADRWLISQFALPSGSERVCFAVSQTSDPTGSYYLYQVITQRFPDYFKLGVWPDPANNAYYMGTNSGFQSQYDVYAMDRASMLAGTTAAPAVFFQNYKNLMMPADVDGNLAPPAGSPALFYTFRDGGEAYFGTPPEDSIDLWAFDVNWGSPGTSTFTNIQSFTPTTGGLQPFNWTVCGFFVSNCLNQPGTAQGLDSGSWWPMKRLQYRNFGDHEALVGTWTVDVTASPDLAAPRWFELRRSGGAWSIFQQGTYSPDSSHRWMPSIAMDGDGNIALGYSVMKDNGGAGDLYPTIRYATRAAGDPLGTLQAEQTLVTGTGAQTHSAARWGDYSSMSIDPTDDCTFWYTSEYLVTSGSAPWQTRIGAFKVPGCGGLAVSPTSIELCGSVGFYDFTIDLFAEFSGSTDLSVTSCPATCNFSDDPIVDPDRDSVLTVSGLNALANGTYNFSVTAQDADSTRNVPLALTVWAAAAGVPSLTAPADGALNQPRKPAFSWGAVADATSYTIDVATDSGFTNIVLTQSNLASPSFSPAANLAAGTTFYWRVGGTNSCGSAGVSATRSFTTGIPSILLVDDDDNAPNVQPTYNALLNSIAVYDTWDTIAAAAEPTLDDLKNYRAVVWFTGDRFCGATTPCTGPQTAGETALGQYLDSGRCLLISSQDYLWDMGGVNHDTATAFMASYLGLGVGNASDTGNYTRVDGQNVYAAYQDLTLTFPYTEYADILVAGASAQEAFRGDTGSTNLGAISKLTANYFTTYASFGLEAFASPTQLAVVNQFLATCDAQVPLFRDDFELGNKNRWSTSFP